MKKDYSMIKDLIKSRPADRADLNRIKRKISSAYKIGCPGNVQLLKAYHRLLQEKRIRRSEKIEFLLIKRPVRSLSGIINISVLSKPHPCPGKCIYCPSEKGIPKSYLSGEPAVERAKKLKFDPFSQAKKRIEMLKKQGHPVDKIDLRIIGGTWSFYPRKYRCWFIKRCFDACNGKKSADLAQAQKSNEKAKHRIVGLSVETRPDFIVPEEIKFLRELGVTKVEMGIQSIHDGVLAFNKRGHGVKEIVRATKLLKNAGFKVSYQLMLNLPGSDPGKDFSSFREVFQNQAYKPDLLKIYPCAIIKKTGLHRMYRQGQYKPYPEKTLKNIVKKIKKMAPYFVRIERITRDIPSPEIVAGPAKISNLREIVVREMKNEGLSCHCIRCREIKEDYNPKEKFFFFRKDYESSGGKEIFLSFENKNRSKLYSLLRLRICGENPADIFHSLKGASLIREIHTFGQMLPLGEKRLAPQHRGLGKKLVKEAENISTGEFGLKKIAVISAVGARPYWRKMGYFLRDTYMVKGF